MPGNPVKTLSRDLSTVQRQDSMNSESTYYDSGWRKEQRDQEKLEEKLSRAEKLIRDGKPDETPKDDLAKEPVPGEVPVPGASEPNCEVPGKPTGEPTPEVREPGPTKPANEGSPGKGEQPDENEEHNPDNDDEDGDDENGPKNELYDKYYYRRIVRIFVVDGICMSVGCSFSLSIA